jgi:hypothetical protein
MSRLQRARATYFLVILVSVRSSCLWPRALAALFLATFLAGCATSVNSLSPAEMQTINIQGIDISYAPNAEIWWGNAEREYAAKVAPRSNTVKPAKSASDLSTAQGAQDGDDYRAIMDTPEAKKYQREKLEAMIRDRLNTFVVPDYKGARPVRIEVVVHGFTIPSPLQRVALGGAPMLAAITVLRDAATGKELAKLDKMSAGTAFHGILGVAVDQLADDLEDRVLDNYVTNVRDWLSGK